MSKEFGDYLRQCRKNCKLTQKQVAQAVHIDRSTYAYYECGTTEPSLITVRKLSEVFGVSLEELLPSTDNRMVAKAKDSRKIQPAVRSKDEEDFLGWYRSLTPRQVEELKVFARKVKADNTK